MSAVQTYVELHDVKIPVAPIDFARSDDGRVYVRYAQTEDEREHLVGVLEDVTLQGERRVVFRSSGDGHRVSVDVYDSEE